MRILSGILRGSTAAILATAIGLGGAACGKNKKENTTGKTGADSTANATVDATLCETSGKTIVTFDLNRDQKPDIWKMYKIANQGGTEQRILTCKQVDFDNDGRKDWVVGYTPQGLHAFEKADFDYDGKFDTSTTYDVKTGKRVEVERDSDFDGRYDVKEIYEKSDKITAARRDRNADGDPDYWEQYMDGHLVAILFDDNFDNKVDRREEVPGIRAKFVAPVPGGSEATGDITPAPAPATKPK